jgi:hypothetical protein
VHGPIEYVSYFYLKLETEPASEKFCPFNQYKKFKEELIAYFP